MAREDEMLLELENKLNYAYAKANTKSKKKRLVYDLILFSNMCYELFDIDKDFAWEDDTEIYELLGDARSAFVDETLRYKNLFLGMSNSVVDTFKEIDFPFYRNYSKEYKNISEKEFQEIIFSFLNDFDPNLEKRLRDKFNNFELFSGSMGNTPGATYPIEVLNKNIIYYASDRKCNIYNACIVMHEFGHEYEFHNLQMTGRRNCYQSVVRRPYYEVSSSFFEYAFARYLKENKIYEKDADIYLDDYYIELLSDICKILIFQQIKDIKVDNQGYVKIEDSVSDYINYLGESLNFYDFSCEVGKRVGYKSAYIYGIGSLFGVYLYENYKDNPNEFKKDFRNALLSYSSIDGIGGFERVGITEDELIKGDILKRVLRNSR